MTLVSTKTATESVLAPQLSHRCVGSAAPLPFAPDCIQGLHGRRIHGIGSGRLAGRVHLRDCARQYVARLRLHGALVACSLNAQKVFDGLFEVSNGEGGAHGKSVGIASIAVNSDGVSVCEVP